MRVLSTLATALTVAIVAGPVLAEGPNIYPVHTKHNYCPQGLQPITIAGVVCCGTPNQSMSYQQVMAHPVRKVHKHHAPRVRHAKTCHEGEKGCY